MKRTFIALDIKLNQEATNILEKIISELNPNSKIKWVNKNQLHLTLKFLGDTSEKIVDSIGEELKKIAVNISDFKIQLTGLGVFKNITNPKVMWLGIDKNNNLHKLQQSIEKSMQQFGFEPENRSFSPHLTIGRIKYMNSNKNLREIIDTYKQFNFGCYSIKEVIFYESKLYNEGPKYILLNSFSLKNG